MRPQETDEQLVRRCLDGDKKAFPLLVERHAGRVYALVYSRLLHHEDATDVTHEAFMQAYKELHRLRAPHSFGAWVYRIAHNGASRTLHRRSREVPEDTRARLEPIPDPKSGQDEFERNEDLKSLIASGLRQLPEHLRIPLVMRYMGEASVQEIALHLATTPKAVERRIAEARNRFRAHFDRTGRTQEALELLHTSGLVVFPTAELARAILDSVSRRRPATADFWPRLSAGAASLAGGLATTVALLLGGVPSRR